MNLASRAMAVVGIIVVVGMFVTGWADASSLEGERYSYETIPTEDVPDVHTGCGEFEANGLGLLTIDSPTPVYDGHWRERRFRGISMFRSTVDVPYGGDVYYIHTVGIKPREGFMVGGANVIDGLGNTWFVKWAAEEDNACDLDPDDAI